MIPSHVAPDRAWMVDAACKGQPVELFHPPKPQWAKSLPKSTLEIEAQAKAFCHRCPVRSECRDYGFTVGRDGGGIYGGLTERQREAIRRRRYR